MGKRYEDEHVLIELGKLFDQHWWFHIRVDEDKDFTLIQFGYEFDMSAEDIKRYPHVKYEGPAKYPVHWFSAYKMSSQFPRHIENFIWETLRVWVDATDYDFNEMYIQSTCDDREGK